MRAGRDIRREAEGPSAVAFDASLAVAACCARGAGRADPVGFCITEAMARRAAALQGAARSLLEARIEERLARHEARLAEFAQTALAPGLADPPRPPLSPPAQEALRRLVERLSCSTVSADADPGLSLAAPAPRPLNALAAHKGTWSRLRAEQRLRQVLAQVPSMAGPLNSPQVVLRALQAMQGLSPAYLEAFVAHADTLLWLEQASGGDLPVRASGAPRGGSRR